MELTVDEEREVMLYNCGCMCPQYEECPEMLDNGMCGLDTPWYDCDDFYAAYSNEVEYGKQDIAAIEKGERDSMPYFSRHEEVTT